MKKFLYVPVDASEEGLRESEGAFETADHISSSTGAADSGKPVITGASGKLDSSLFDIDGAIRFSFSVGSWSGPSLGFYNLLIAHGLNSIDVEIYVVDSGNVPVEVERVLTSVDEITLRVPYDPDLRFAGYVWVRKL